MGCTEEKQLNNVYINRFYPQDSAQVVAVRFYRAGESQPFSLPPAAASPASVPGIQRLQSPHTHHLSETLQGNFFLLSGLKKK